MDIRLESIKFLVTGSTGLVGRQVVKDLVEKNHEVYSCYHQEKPDTGIPVHLDLADYELLTKILQKTKPDVILHLGAMTNVDLCESQPELAMKINSKSTEILVKESAKLKSFFVYVSTDYIFDGKKGMKKESDTPQPLCVYGKTKLEGENAVMNMASSWCIARTSTPFGIHPTKKSFPLWVVENLQNNKKIEVVNDQYTSPTYVPNLSQMLIELGTRQMLGVIHLAGKTRISRYDLALLMTEKLNLNSQLISPTSMESFSWKAKRPRDSSLDVSKANSTLNEKPLSIEESLNSFINDIKSTNKS